MQKRSRRRFSAAFKAQVVLEALSERQSLEELARKHELHPTQISTWRKEFVANAAAAYSTARQKATSSPAAATPSNPTAPKPCIIAT